LSNEKLLVAIDQAEIRRLHAEMEEISHQITSLRQLVEKALSQPRKFTPAPVAPEEPEQPELPEGKISMLPARRTEAFKLIHQLASEHMDKEFTTSTLTLLQKRVFSLLNKRYDFVRQVRKEGRSIVYRFKPEALDSVCEVTLVQFGEGPRPPKEALERLKKRYPHFSYRQDAINTREYKLTFTDITVRTSVLNDLARDFGRRIRVQEKRPRS